MKDTLRIIFFALAIIIGVIIFFMVFPLIMKFFGDYYSYIINLPPWFR